MHQNVIKPSFQNDFGIETNILGLIFTENSRRIYMLEHLPPLGEIEHGHHILKFRYNFEPKLNSIITPNQSKLLYNKGNYKDLELFFNDICWDKEFRGLDVQECYSKWLLIYEKGCKLHIPELKTSSNNQNRVKKNVLWMTKELKSMCNNKRDHWSSIVYIYKTFLFNPPGGGTNFFT
jgi:hypothetical protein